MARRDPRVEGALRLVVRARPGAVVRTGGKLGERPDHPRRVDVREPEAADPRGVDDPAGVLGERQRHRARRGVPAPAGHRVDDADRPVRLGHERVDQRRLADAGVADEDARTPRQPGPQRRQRLAAAHHDERHVKGLVRRDERVGGGQVGLREDEQRRQARVVRRDQATVDQPGARFGVGHGGHDRELVGVGDDDALDRIGVVGGTAQHRRPGLDADDPGQRVGGAGEVAHDGDPVAHDDALAPQLAGLHRRDEAGVDEAAVAAAVHGHDEALGRVVVPRPVLGPWTRAAARTDPHVVLVEVRTPPA
jgi:hypothetical protein